MNRTPTPADTTNTQRHAALLGAWLASYGLENTRAAYRRDAQIFLTYLEATGLDLLAVRRAHVDVFARTRQAAGDAPTTLNRRLAAVSALYTYALDEGRLQLNPVVRVRRATVDADHSITAALTRREAEDLLAAARSHSPRARTTASTSHRGNVPDPIHIPLLHPHTNTRRRFEPHRHVEPSWQSCS